MSVGDFIRKSVVLFTLCIFFFSCTHMQMDQTKNDFNENAEEGKCFMKDQLQNNSAENVQKNRCIDVIGNEELGALAEKNCDQYYDEYQYSDYDFNTITRYGSDNDSYLKQIKVPEAWEYFKKNNPDETKDGNKIEFRKPDKKIRVAVVEDVPFLKHIDYRNNLSEVSYYIDGEEQSGLEPDKKKVFYNSSDEAIEKLVGLDNVSRWDLETTKKLVEGLKLAKEVDMVGLSYKIVEKTIKDMSDRRQLIVNAIKDKKKSIAFPQVYYADKKTDESDISGSASVERKIIEQADHATNVTGLIAANHNDIGIKGVCPYAKIIPVYVDFYKGTAGKGIYSDSIIDPLREVLDKEVQLDVINLSRDLPSTKPIFETTNIDTVRVLEHFKQVKRKGEDIEIPIVVAAGNKSTPIDKRFILKKPFIPVGFVDKELKKDKESNYLQDQDKKLLFAPGRDIFTTSFLTSTFFVTRYSVDNKFDDGNWGRASGSSFSAPLVSGVICLMLAANPVLNFDTITNILYENKDSIKIDDAPNGVLLNAVNAVRKSFVKVITDWERYWNDGINKNKFDLYASYYDNDSIIVRGSVSNKNQVVYTVYSNRKNIDYKKEVMEPITKEMDNDNTTKKYGAKVSFDKKIRTLEEFRKKMELIYKKYGSIKVHIDTSKDNETFAAGKDNVNIETMNLKLDQSYSTNLNDNVSVAHRNNKRYEDNGKKMLNLKRKGDEWIIEKELWIYAQKNKEADINEKK
ncbi:MAG: S8 family serine peptidase [Nitrospirae bacterium]|nr:S8 family serine peptidase [Nitrospirota bacterium]MBF0534709.1 S8 family serine peptidase [Nitrospirota bacterium]MBF0616383.1 S8 family serine peptidase [Nitrospirota bacterium]